MRCTACDFDNREDVRFCEDCGAPLGSACPACGAAVPGGRRFCGACGARLEETAPDRQRAPRDDSLAAWARQPGDRRPVTLLFADITGSTALTERLDPEATHDLLYGAVQRLCEAVEANRGTVCRFMGDGVMAVFGAPHAHEDHALDACRAALEMQSAVAAYDACRADTGEDGLRIRVGLHSGEVVVLRVGEGEDAGVDASGPSVPIAARMEQAAEPGTVLMTGATRALAGSRIRAAARPAVRVKGISEPLPVYVLGGLRDADASSEVRGRFVGRRAELSQLLSLLGPVGEGGGQMAHLRGEPGIGKTRLVQELMDRAAESGFACHKALVLDFGTGKGRDAVRTLMRGLVGLRPGADKADRTAELDGAIARALIDADDRVFANDLLDLPQPVELRALYDAMSNAERVRGKHRVVVELVRRASRIRPRLLVVEDLHWADPQTLDQVASIADTVRDCPALLVTTSREDGDPVDATWRMRMHETALTVIELGPLRREESAMLVGTLLVGEEELAAGCIERAAGNPLFLEQLVRNAAEKNAGDGLPDTIQTLVLARMDRLEPTDREALQAAAVLGQRFDAESLRALTGAADYDPAPLVAHHLLRPEGDGYLFAHALVRDGVYASLLRATRQGLHRRAAEFFADGDPSLRAEHLAEAQDPAAPSAFLDAARAERRAHRYGRARALAERGLALASERADRAALQQFAARVLLDLGEAHAAIEAGGAALELADDDAGRCRARLGVALAMRVVDRLEEAFEALDAAEAEALRADLPLELSRIHHLRGNLHFPRGEFGACRAAHERALEAARRAHSVKAQTRAFGGLGDAAYAEGRMRTAKEYFERCVTLCRRHGFGGVEVANRSMVGFSQMFLNEIRAAHDEGVATVEAARRVGNGRAALLGEIQQHFVAIEVGDHERILVHTNRSMALIERLGARRFVAQAMAGCALALAGTGQRAEACAQVEQARASCEATNIPFTGAPVLAIAALVLESPQARRAALAEGERVLAAGSVGHSHLLFYRDAMSATLALQDFAEVERYAAALETYTREEPLPWADFFVARARALVAHARGARDDALRQTLWRLREEATTAGLGGALPDIEEALGS